MSLVVILGSLTVAGAVPLLFFSATVGRSSGDRISRNLSAGLAVPGDFRQLVLAQPARVRAVDPSVAGLARRARRLTPAGWVENVEKQLHLAGDPWPLERFLAAKLLLAATATAASIVWAVGHPSLSTVLFVIAAVAIGVLAPDAAVAAKARHRQERILLELPDTLDQLTICVEAGLGFDAALARVAAASRRPLGSEISRVLQDVKIGIPPALTPSTG